MDREMTFEEIGDYKVSAKVYKVMKQSLFSSLKELVQDYEFKVVVDESGIVNSSAVPKHPKCI